MQPSTNNPTSLLPSLVWMIGMSLRMKTNILQSVLVDMKAAKAAKGDVISSIFEYDMEVTDVIPAENMPTFQETKHREAELRLNYWKNVKFKYKDDFLSGNGVYQDFVPNSITTASIVLVDYVTNILSATLRVTPNVLVGTTTPLGTYDALVDLNELISSDAPSVFRSALFGRKTEALLFKQAQMTTQDFHAPSSSIRGARLPNTLGYDLIAYQPNLACTAAKGINEITGDIDLTIPTGMEPYSEYTVTVVVDAGNDAKKFYPGNILIAQNGTDDQDNTTSLVVHEEATVTGTSATIKVSAGRCFYDLSAGAITAKMLNISDDAFAYQKFGIGLASRPSSHVGKALRSFHIDDQVNGFAYGLTCMEGYYMQLLSLDSLFGTSILTPSYTARAVQVPTAGGGYVV